MTSVLGIQCLLFQDGGLLALGFNVVNMGILSAFVGYGIYVILQRVLGKKPIAQTVSAGLAAWFSVAIASVACALELAVSGASPLNIALPAMVSVHLLIGIGEALITVAALTFIRQTRPDLMGAPSKSATQGWGWIAIGLLIALAITFASSLADSNPDGLNRVAEDQGFTSLEQPPAYELMPGYSVPFIQDGALTTVAAGVIGVLAVAGVSYSVARFAARKPNKSQEIV